MKVLVTGAGGFLGRSVVRAAAGAGHHVVAMHRPASLPDPASLPAGVEILPGDLRQPGRWAEHLSGIEAVIHCAAAASGNLPTQLAGTVVATENLLAALPGSLKRFVHVSSLSVYDFSAPRWHGCLDEDTPLESRPLRRDAYTQTKLQQEAMVRAHCAGRPIGLVVVRPGAIYGPGKDWDFGRAMRIGRFDLIFAPLSPMRLTHVGNCADAIVAALAVAPAGETIVNLIDDEQPSHWAYHRLARRAGLPAGIGIGVPYLAVRALGLLARLASRLGFAGKARLPELLDLPRQEVRWRPLRYPNARARQALGWSPAVSLREGVAGLAAAQQAQADLPESGEPIRA